MEPEPPLLESILSGSAEVEGCIAALLKCPKQSNGATLAHHSCLSLHSLSLIHSAYMFSASLHSKEAPRAHVASDSDACLPSRRSACMRALLSLIPASPLAAGKPLGNSYR